MSSGPIPVVVTGKGEYVGRLVVDTMQPEYEVINFTVATAINEELPFLLSGKAPPSPSSTVGTGNWSTPPQALLLGGAYGDEDIDAMMKSVDQMDGAAKIPWLRLDRTKSTLPPPPPQLNDEQAKLYGMDIATRMKKTLDQLKSEGKLGPGNSGIHLV